MLKRYIIYSLKKELLKIYLKKVLVDPNFPNIIIKSADEKKVLICRQPLPFEGHSNVVPRLLRSFSSSSLENNMAMS